MVFLNEQGDVGALLVSPLYEEEEEEVDHEESDDKEKEVAWDAEVNGAKSSPGC